MIPEEAKRELVALLGPRGYRDPSVMKNFYKIVDHYQAISFSSVPTVLSVLLDIPKGDADISSLRYAICGAAPLSVELFKRFEEHSGMKILEGYGLTEVGPNNFMANGKLGTIGHPMPFVDVKLISADGNAVPTGGEGEILLKGPNVCAGYLNKPDATQPIEPNTRICGNCSEGLWAIAMALVNPQVGM